MTPVPGAALAASRARPLAARAGRGLLETLAGPGPVPRWRSPWQRRAGYAVLTAGTTVACVASLISMTSVSDFLHGGLKRFHYYVPSPLLMPLRTLLANHPLGPAEVVALLVVLPLPLVARYPLMGWRFAWAGLLLVPLAGIHWLGWAWGPAQLAVLAAAFCVAGVRHSRPVLWWMWALTLVPWWLWAGTGSFRIPAAVLGTVVLTAGAAGLDGLGSWRRARQALADQAELTGLEQARRAVLEERARIARELHDVVAHHLSLIAVQAETAPYRIPGLPERMSAEFGTLSEAARAALTDMRRLLGVLRHDEAADRAPQPQLTDLPVLIEATRRAGVAVELAAPPALGQVPSGVAVCAYRIVQESLSNASRHAPGAPVTVSVDQDEGAVRLRVVNGPGGAGPPVSGHRPGHGITGMRERAAMLGGSLSAGPAADGGFVVSAVLPLTGAA